MATGVEPELIRAMPLFHELSEQELVVVARLLHRAVYSAGIDIMRMEEPGEATYLILEGTVKIAVEQPDGSSVILALLGPGEVVGELGVIQQTGRSATVTTLERSLLFWMHRAAFQDCLRQIPAINRNLVLILAGRLRLANEQVLLFATQDVYGRVARILLAFAGEYGKPEEDGAVSIPLRLTQSDLAGLVSASRVRVNQVMAAFRDSGWIEVSQRHHITIRDLAALQRRSQSR